MTLKEAFKRIYTTQNLFFDRFPDHFSDEEKEILVRLDSNEHRMSIMILFFFFPILFFTLVTITGFISGYEILNFIALVVIVISFLFATTWTGSKTQYISSPGALELTKLANNKNSNISNEARNLGIRLMKEGVFTYRDYRALGSENTIKLLKILQETKDSGFSNTSVEARKSNMDFFQICADLLGDIHREYNERYRQQENKKLVKSYS